MRHLFADWVCLRHSLQRHRVKTSVWRCGKLSQPHSFRLYWQWVHQISCSKSCLTCTYRSFTIQRDCTSHTAHFGTVKFFCCRHSWLIYTINDFSVILWLLLFIFLLYYRLLDVWLGADDAGAVAWRRDHGSWRWARGISAVVWRILSASERAHARWRARSRLL